MVLAAPTVAAAKPDKSAILSGTVTNSLTGCPLVGATVTVGAFELFTNGAGRYFQKLPAGDYDVSFAFANFVPHDMAIALAAGEKADLDMALDPVAPVLVEAAITGDAVPGATLDATVSVEVFDGSDILDVAWIQHGGAVVSFDGVDIATAPGGAFCKFDSAEGVATVNLGSAAAYKEALFHLLSEPPVTADQLPPNIPLPPGEFPGGAQDRFEVAGVNPFVLEELAEVFLAAEVTTTSGAYHAELDVHTHLPWKPATGVRDVPIGVAVLLNGKDQGAYDWALSAPDGSAAVLNDPASQYPDFTPDLPGPYQVTVTDEAAAAPVTIQIYAGTWQGAISGQDFDGRPEADGCTGCHFSFAPDKFTPWAETGHAEIFSNNLNTSTHYGPNCFGCHTVGYDPDANNGGMDDAEDYEDFLAAGLLNNPGDNWTTMLDNFPAAARLANIQCENCHGPQVGAAHGLKDPRLSLSSDVCAVCHGEPLRHARFQQWQLSGHANYELAIDEGGSGNCSRCHTGNGFLNWLPILLDDDPATDPTASISVEWSSDEVHPQTCVTCHDPHAIGTTTGINTNATVRISGDTPPLIAGFTATFVGRGAICMTCHNSRRGLRNDGTFPGFYGTSEAARAPHGSAQTDVLMGQNAYLVPVGNRGDHSWVEDTCVDCHMEETPPPDALSYNQGGTNHTFYASPYSCEGCHGEGFDAEGLQNLVQANLDELQGQIEEALFDLIAAQIAAGNSIDFDGDAVPEIVATADIAEIVFGESHGRQSIEVTFTDDTTLGPFRMNDVDVLNAVPVKIGELYDFADPNLIKAGWNWNLINNDGSKGVHHPSFVLDILAASSDAL
jgi:hypothetical protein